MIDVVAVNIAVIGVAVMLHYEFLYRISLLLPRLHVPHRLRILAGVVLALTAHAVEVWVFAVSFYLMHHAPGWGHLQGNLEGTLLDFVYFSLPPTPRWGRGTSNPWATCAT